HEYRAHALPRGTLREAALSRGVVPEPGGHRVWHVARYEHGSGAAVLDHGEDAGAARRAGGAVLDGHAAARAGFAVLDHHPAGAGAGARGRASEPRCGTARTPWPWGPPWPLAPTALATMAASRRAAAARRTLLPRDLGLLGQTIPHGLPVGQMETDGLCLVL